LLLIFTSALSFIAADAQTKSSHSLSKIDEDFKVFDEVKMNRKMTITLMPKVSDLRSSTLNEKLCINMKIKTKVISIAKPEAKEYLLKSVDDSLIKKNQGNEKGIPAVRMKIVEQIFKRLGFF
jgi:50S ribosomal subunit-associated GTPase HflX